MGSMWTDGQLSAVQAQLARVKQSIERYDRLRARNMDDEIARSGQSRYWSRELDADEPEADDLWDDAQDAERFARGCGFDSADDYEWNAASAFEDQMLCLEYP